MKYFIVFITVLIALASCTKGPRKLPISSMVLQYFNYRPGSYWVYKDSVTGASDSIVVYANDRNNVLNQGGEVLSDVMWIYFDLYTDQTKVRDPFTLLITNNNIGFTCYNRLKDSDHHGYDLTEVPFVAPKMNKNATGVDYVRKIDFLSIDGQDFADVLEVHGHSNDSFSKYDDWMYVTLNEGIVKMKFNASDPSTTSTYFLKKWDIKINN